MAFIVGMSPGAAGHHHREAVSSAHVRLDHGACRLSLDVCSAGVLHGEVCMALAEGAIQLGLMHLSIRVPWHDTDWTGRVCERPGENHFCAVLKNIKERKDSETESDDSRLFWADLPRRRIPPCVF